MTTKSNKTDSAEFMRFHLAITRERPDYEPHYLKVAAGNTVKRNGNGEPIDKHGNPVSADSPNRINMGKRAVEMGHKLITAPQAVKLLDRGFNVGIEAETGDQWVLIDVDDPEVVKPSEVKPTLTTRSRKRAGYHYFYIATDPRLKNLGITDVGEIRSGNQYVLAPGSWVDTFDIPGVVPEDEAENAGKYTLESDAPIAHITFDELPKAFRDAIEAKEESNVEGDRIAAEKHTRQAARKAAHPESTDDEGSALFRLELSDVIHVPKGNPGMRFKNPLHPGGTGTSAGISDKGFLHCFSHGVTHTALSALSVLAGVADCENAGQGHGTSIVGASTVDYTDGHTLWKIWSFAKHGGMLPANDPIPAAAIRWYAVDQGLCKEIDIKDGWKLPAGTYQRTLKLIESKENVSPGRAAIATPPPQLIQTAASPETTISADMFLVGDKNIFDVNGFAKWLIFESGHFFKTLSDTEEVLRYKDGVYLHDGDMEIGKLIEQIMDGVKVTKNAVNEIIGHVRRRTYTERNEFDSDKRIINLENGLYDMRTGELSPHTPEYLSLHKSPVVYDPAATCPRIDSFFREVLLEKHIVFMYELFGYALLKEKLFDTAVLFEGGGANGKSRMIGLLDMFAGSDVTAHVTPSELSGDDKFAVADLFGKLLNTIDDLGNTPLKNLGVFKSIISGAEQRGQYKYEKAFKFTPTVLCVFGCNEVPITTDTSDGFFRRMITVPFLQQFDGDKADKNLFSKLTTQNELSGLFNKTMKAVSDTLVSGKFTCVGTIEDQKQTYLYASNPIARFCDEQCSFNDPDDYISKNELYNQYVMWARDNCIRVKTKGAMTTYLEEMGCVVRQFTDDESMRYRAYVGVRIKTVAQVMLVD